MGQVEFVGGDESWGVVPDDGGTAVVEDGVETVHFFRCEGEGVDHEEEFVLGGVRRFEVEAIERIDWGANAVEGTGLGIEVPGGEEVHAFVFGVPIACAKEAFGVVDGGNLGNGGEVELRAFFA